jgi:hypothetical protein
MDWPASAAPFPNFFFSMNAFFICFFSKKIFIFILTLFYIYIYILIRDFFLNDDYFFG